MSQPDKKLLDGLLEFQSQNKFSLEAWNSRGLNPSSSEMTSFLNDFFNKCAEQLINEINNNSPKKNRREILKSNLSLLDNENYDTEEREFIYDLFYELAGMVGINLGTELNKWLYGELYQKLLDLTKKIEPKEIIDTLIQPCTKCSLNLETDVTKKNVDESGNKWYIVKCKNCNELNIISMGKDVKEFSIKNYESIDWIMKSYATFEKAVEQLAQIKHSKK
ncbi:MAG: hypothetical protein JWR50_574 [Mucilaginibacter sp.]|nr:hypothetical protein [Mucilaginibacter sp.]